MSMKLFRPGGLALTQKGADAIELQPGDRVLDIGCGLGTSLVFLRKIYGIEPYGIDLQEAVVKKAEQMLGAGRIKQADACALPFSDAFFDAVFMECVLTLTASPEKALREIQRVLKPGGRLVLSGLDGADVLCERGRIGREALLRELNRLQLKPVFFSDETAALRRFVAHIIFQYGSLAEYIREANCTLGGCVLNCHIPSKHTGYMLVAARKYSCAIKEHTRI